MIIQKLIGPTKTECSDVEMFFRVMDGEAQAKIDGMPVSILPGEVFSLETYFNSFSVGKWKKYTKLKNLSLVLCVQGEIVVRAFHAIGQVDQEKMGDDWKTDSFYEGIHVTRRELPCEVTKKKLADSYEYTVGFSELPCEGIIYVTLESSDGAELLSGAYCTEIDQGEITPVELALGICTFQREDFLKKNVNLIIRQIIENKQSPLHGHVEVYISDNGQSLAEDTFKNKKVHLFPNKNAGGAGGFTRTMIEALFREKETAFTHMILMDDDIILSADVVERTYHFLQMLNTESKKKMVGGEMFMLDKRYRQFEAGARWNGTQVKFYNKMWDMRRRDCVSANEVINPINYSGWWYSVIPTEIITEQNLPVPMFIHYDDMEYGVRNEDNGTILLNGICVWHPQSVNKAPTRMTYYDVRNMMIGMCDRSDRATSGEMIRHITNRVIGGVIRYRYEDAEICFEAVRDFYRGPSYFMTLDPLKKHAELVKYNYTYEDPSAYNIDLSKLRKNVYRRGNKIVFLWGLLLWLLPSTHSLKVSGLEDIGLPFGARKMFHYDEDKKQGYMTQKSYRRAWRDFIEYCKLMHMIWKKHDQMMDMWAAAKKEYISLPFWEKYLEL